jgi:hypothetical protein
MGKLPSGAGQTNGPLVGAGVVGGVVVGASVVLVVVVGASVVVVAVSFPIKLIPCDYKRGACKIT